MLKPLLVSLAAALAVSCSSSQSSKKPAKPKKPAIDPVRWSCTTDKDCANSCSLGAVNLKWYRANQARIRECDDGCAGPWSAKPKCIKGSCTAFNYKGRRVDDCTRRKR